MRDQGRRTKPLRGGYDSHHRPQAVGLSNSPHRLRLRARLYQAPCRANLGYGEAQRRVPSASFTPRPAVSFPSLPLTHLFNLIKAKAVPVRGFVLRGCIRKADGGRGGATLETASRIQDSSETLSAVADGIAGPLARLSRRPPCHTRESSCPARRGNRSLHWRSCGPSHRASSRPSAPPFVVLDAELRVWEANASFYQAFGASPEQTEGRPIHELGDGQWDIPTLRRLLR